MPYACMLFLLGLPCRMGSTSIMPYACVKFWMLLLRGLLCRMGPTKIIERSVRESMNVCDMPFEDLWRSVRESINICDIPSNTCGGRCENQWRSMEVGARINDATYHQGSLEVGARINLSDRRLWRDQESHETPNITTNITKTRIENPMATAL